MTQIAWPTLGIEPRAVHRQLFKPAVYSVKPQGQGVLIGLFRSNRERRLTFRRVIIEKWMYIMRSFSETYNRLPKLPNSEKKRKITVITPFKAIQGHRIWYQSKAHMDFLLVINTKSVSYTHLTLPTKRIV